MKPPVSRAGNEPVFNGAALYAGCDAVFICEGAFDAMAIMQGASGRHNIGAVALGGVGGGRLLDMLTMKPTSARLLIAFDADDAGVAGARALAAKLDGLGLTCEIIDSAAAFGGGCMKDACDLQRLDPSLMPDCVEFMLYEPASKL